MNNGYDYVSEYVKAFWKENGACDVAILLMLDGEPHEVIAFCQSDSNYADVTFLTDFWEGEEKIIIQDITPLYELLQDYRDAFEGVVRT